MNFHIEKHPRTNVTLVSIDDDIVVALDEHQTQLQTLLSSKFISHFIDNVITWKSQMSTADMVLQLLTDVQRTWSNLEAIFIATDDIRIQLPEETAAFDRIDAEFKVNKMFFVVLMSVECFFGSIHHRKFLRLRSPL
jgi:dynein heavy chain